MPSARACHVRKAQISPPDGLGVRQERPDFRAHLVLHEQPGRAARCCGEGDGAWLDMGRRAVALGAAGRDLDPPGQQGAANDCANGNSANPAKRRGADATSRTPAHVAKQASRSLVLIIRRSWVRSPPAPPAHFSHSSYIRLRCSCRFRTLRSWAHWQIHWQEPVIGVCGPGMLVLGKLGWACVTGVSRAFTARRGRPGQGGCQWICQCGGQFSSPLLAVAGVAAVAAVGCAAAGAPGRKTRHARRRRVRRCGGRNRACGYCW